MKKNNCTKKGETLAEACKAIFACVEQGRVNPWFCYQCEKCNQYHICKEPK
jgi:hypothetical protein